MFTFDPKHVIIYSMNLQEKFDREISRASRSIKDTGYRGPMLVGCAANGEQTLVDCKAIGFVDISEIYCDDSSIAVLSRRNKNGKVVGVFMSGPQLDKLWEQPETYSDMYPRGVLPIKYT